MTRTHVVEADFEAFLDALDEANETQTRVRAHDLPRLYPLLAELEIDLSPLQLAALEHLQQPKVAFIESGLMKGAWAYSLETEKCFTAVATEQTPRPLARHVGMQYDLVVSYSSLDRDSIAMPLLDALTEASLRVFLVDVAHDPQDPLWQVRFREAMFHANYLVPILSGSYLSRPGTQTEMQDAAAFTVRHRSDEFFYPLLPLIDPNGPGVPPPHVDASVHGPDDRGFVWTHVFGLRWDLDPNDIARFFRSLVANASGRPHLEYLRVVADSIRWVREGSIARGPVTEFYLAHPSSGYYTFLVGPDGTNRYLGVHGPGDGSVAVDDGLIALRKCSKRHDISLD